jgi:hypothetical protein
VIVKEDIKMQAHPKPLNYNNILRALDMPICLHKKVSLVDKLNKQNIYLGELGLTN